MITCSKCCLVRPAWCVWYLCPVESISRALWLWVVLSTMVTRHESLQLFPLGLSQRLYEPLQPENRSGVACTNLNCCWREHRWHVAWHSWQVCGSFTASPLCLRIYWTCIHMKTTSTQTLHESELSVIFLALQKIMTIPYIETVACFPEYLVILTKISSIN